MFATLIHSRRGELWRVDTISVKTLSPIRLGTESRSTRAIESLPRRRSFAPLRRTVIAMLSVVCVVVISSQAHAEETGDIITVYSSVNPIYRRDVQPDGSFRRETYAFGEGGYQGSPQKDFTIDGLSFMDVAHIIAQPLALQNYLPCDPKDPNHTDLLIMVYWGTTTGTDRASSSPEYQIAQGFVPPPMPPMPPPPDGTGGTAMASDPSTSGRASLFAQAAAIKAANDGAQQLSSLMTGMANRQRDRQNSENAAILGYAEEMKRVDGYVMTAFEQQRRDIVDEVEESRYYVVLLAYDFQTLLKHKERKLLWQTRYSIPERRNDFGKQLAAMIQSASRYFGQDSHGLLRKPLPATTVTLGELKTLGVESESKK